jgi:trans-aconitate methyltransferase
MENFDISVKRFDEFADQYAQRFMNIESYSDSIDRFCNLIRNDYPKILELGCGPGNITRLLKLRFPESRITALDLAPRMIEIAQKQLPDVDFRIMDVRNISMLPEKFDAVMCSFCLPFLSKDDAAKLIADCYEKLNSGGVLYISTMEGDENEAGFESTSFSGTAEVYFNYHRQSDLETAFQKGGFEIEQIKCQDYVEPDGSLTKDLILIGVKN